MRRIMDIRFLLILVLGLSALAGLYAQESADEAGSSSDSQTQTSEQAGKTEEIIVSAPRYEMPVDAIPGTVYVLSAQDIKESGAKTLPELLASLPGIGLRDYGSTGSIQNISVRGSGSSQILVLLDGQALNSSRDGGVDWNLVPLASIERIEILPGSGGSLYGSSALGGVINIVRKDVDGFSADIRVKNTSYLPLSGVTVDASGTASDYSADPLTLLDGQNVDAWLGFVLGEAKFTVDGNFTRAANQWLWYDEDYASNRVRDNAQYLAGNLGFGADLGFSGGNLKINLDGGLNTLESPGSLSYISTDAVQSTDSFQSNAALHLDQVISKALDLDAKIKYRYDHLAYSDSYSDDDHKTNSMVAELAQKLDLGSAFKLNWGAGYGYDAVTSTSLGDVSRNYGDIFIASPLSFDIVDVNIGVRLDMYDTFDPAVSADLGAALHLGEAGRIDLKLATAFRAPTLNDLYWPSDTWTSGNASLKPERSWSAELGGNLDLEGFTLRASTFVRYVQDEIQWMSDPATWIYKPENIGETLVPGAQLDGDLNLIDDLDIKLSYTFMHGVILTDSSGVSHDLSEDLRLSYTPDHELKTSIRYSPDILDMGLSFTLVSAQYTDEANTESAMLDLYGILDFDTSIDLGSGFELGLEIDNLLNQVYQTVLGYPMPPISFGLNFSYHK